MTIQDISNVLQPGVKGLLNKTQATNLVLSMILIALDAIDEDSLRFMARFFTPDDYNDLVQERAVISHCGYPLCGNTLIDRQGKPRKPPNHPLESWKRYWCSPHCYQASMFYRKQLSPENLVTRKDIAWLPFGDMAYENNTMFLDEMQAIAKTEGKTVGEVVAEALKRNITINNGMKHLSIDSSPASPSTNDTITNLSISER